MTSVSDMILKQFADNFSIKAQAVANEPASEPAASGESSTEKNADGTETAESTQPKADPSASEQPKMQSELNGLAIAWMLIKNFFARLFGK